VVSSNFPNRPFRLEEGVYVWGQNAWWNGNNTLLHSELWIRKNSYSPTWQASGASYNMVVNGVSVGSNGNFGYDFRNSDQMLIHASDNWFGNDSEGHMYVTIAGYCNGGTLGYTEVHSGFWAPRIAQPAAAPTGFWPDEITATSMRYRFSGNDLRGGSLYGWEFQYADNPSFNNATLVGSNGTSTVTGLKPATTYYFRSRAQTSAGAGSWSGTTYAKTLSSVKVSSGAAPWLAPQVLYSNGNTWLSPEILVSVNGAWVVPAD